MTQNSVDWLAGKMRTRVLVWNLPILRLARHKTGGAALFGDDAIPIKSAIEDIKN